MTPSPRLVSKTIRMQFQDEGYIIDQRKHGEKSLILTVLTRHHGKMIGYVKNCLSKKSLGIYQLGNHIAIDAYARTQENMWSFRVELVEPCAVNFINDFNKLSILSAFCSLTKDTLPQEDNLERFYYYIESFFSFINEENWLTHYAYFEFYLLEYLGIGLDLSECSATGTKENLRYVSPKTGKAVCAQAGEPYKDRLFDYPEFIITHNYTPTPKEIYELLRMTEFFLRKNFFQIHGLKFPENRATLLSTLRLSSD